MSNSKDIFNLSSQAFDSSSHLTMTKEEFISEITPKIHEILKKAFPGNASNQKIRVHKDRISFAAPCCGDSAHHNYKKRGNIILEGKFKNLYKCFNCGTCMSVQNFLKTYGQNISLGMADYISDKARGFAKESSSNVSYLYDDETIDEYAIDREYFRQILNLTECNE